VAGQLTITGAQRVELITNETFTTTPVGTSFVVVTATLQNTGRSPLELGVGELVLLDAADTAFPGHCTRSLSCVPAVATRCRPLPFRRALS
jgi:hypothetical protein